MPRMKPPVPLRWLPALLYLAMGAGCVSPGGNADRRERQARHDFNQVVRELHVPAGDATNDVMRGELLTNAVKGYLAIVQQYPDQPQWGAQALRSVANIHRAEGRRGEALAAYARIAHKYPGQDWEIIQAWKSAGDLLWESKMKELARDYYRQIVTAYGEVRDPPMFQTIADIARRRLAGDSQP
jgi:tetratricopeptide (TPR) repeat protein